MLLTDLLDVLSKRDAVPSAMKNAIPQLKRMFPDFTLPPAIETNRCSDAERKAFTQLCKTCIRNLEERSGEMVRNHAELDMAPVQLPAPTFTPAMDNLLTPAWAKVPTPALEVSALGQLFGSCSNPQHCIFLDLTAFPLFFCKFSTPLLRLTQFYVLYGGSLKPAVPVNSPCILTLNKQNSAVNFTHCGTSETAAETMLQLAVRQAARDLPVCVRLHVVCSGLAARELKAHLSADTRAQVFDLEATPAVDVLKALVTE
eukprot:TRINITY_DN35546_c0_g2_i1.p1 TRINITY_DN35546_c0_g2~~TRINITY_DN35546_c0_g2_i1.p1  ORF type:complete len:258 (+),score=16.97 TRINITY_DN35546_c0_g2_i1:296-1069(+)